MLIGKYIHTLDNKRRLAIPSKLRNTIGESVVIVKGTEPCIYLYPLEEYEKESNSTKTLRNTKDSRDYRRFFYASSHDVEVDSAGRILIPEEHVIHASLKDKVVVAGVENHIEIWDKNKFDTYMPEIDKRSTELLENLNS